MRSILWGLGAVVLAASVGLASCGDDGDDTASTSGSTTGSVDGSMDGSSVTVRVTSTDFQTVPPTSTTSPPTTTAPLQPGDTIPTESTYTIVSGDYPSTVAARFKVNMEEMLALNDLVLEGSMVPGWTVGAVIKIPAGATVPGEAPATTAPPGDTSTAGSGAATTQAPVTTVDVCAESTYEIQPGDAPSTVAAKFDTTVEALAAANANTPNYDSFIAGFTIKIPAKTDC